MDLVVRVGRPGQKKVCKYHIKTVVGLVKQMKVSVDFYVMQYILRRKIQETGVNGEKESEKPKSLKC